MKILIITPKYLPQICGVGDHARHLFEAFKERNIDVSILTFDSTNHFDNGVYFCNGTKEAIDRIIRTHHFTDLLIEWTPNLWAKNGRSFNYPLFDICSLSKKSGIKIHTYIHEARYPIFSDLRGLFFGPRQFLWLAKIINYSNTIFYSSEQVEAQAKNIFLPVSLNHSIIPVSSNIYRVGQRQINENAGIIKMCVYARPHPTKLDSWNIDLVKSLCIKYENIKFELYLIGVEEELEYSKIDQYPNFKKICTGNLSESDLSILLDESDILISPYLDGVGTRRGGLFSGMAHEMKVVSNISKRSPKHYNWSDFLYAEEGYSHFLRMGHEAVSDVISKNDEKNIQALSAYNSFFSWGASVDKILEGIKNSE